MQCPNCSHKIKTKYCGHCGQRVDHHSQPTFHDFYHETVHEFLHLDGKIFQSLKLLMTKPGQLTAEFFSGRRVRYIGPLRLYLTMSLIYFVLSTMTHGSKVAGIELKISTSTLKSVKTNDYKNDTRLDFGTNNVSINFTGDEETSENPLMRFFTTGIDVINKNPTIFVEKIQKAFPKMLFLLVPLFAFFLWFTYRRQKQTWFSCLYFSLHFHAAAFAGLTLTIPFTIWAPEENLPETVWFIWLLVYLSISLRTVWKDSRGKSYARATAILSVYSLCFISSIVILMVIQMYMLGARA